MRKAVNNRRRKWIISALAVITGIGILWNIGNSKVEGALAASITQKETVKLRIIGTTDIHGQLNSKDYEQGVDYNNGGLARLYDLIQKTRSEVPAESVITLDTGDVIFDYTTEYIFAENQQEIQPIFQAMTRIGYDAITLGNHEFDYGYEYILRQLNGTGLKDITVVSNVTDSKTGEYPFLENMMITRTLTSSAGNKIEVKVGIIGQTIPTLSSKTHSYTGILKTEDMVENAKTQAAKLKEMGADVIIALSHTGIGPENPEPNFKNVAYALTKIEDIDVVVCGHEHNLFPTTDMTSPYYQLPNVDRKTYLMNGKNVIMAGNRGSALGVVDLTLSIYKDTKRIAERTSELRMVTDKNTTENKEIASAFGAWEEKLLHYSTDIIAKLKDGELIQNFFGMLGDNAAIQLLNDAKIDYAKRYVQTSGSQYKDYPVIAASTYMAYGAADVEDFINIHDDITESELSAIQPYNNYLYLYTITGKQVKEWLEWSASAYESTVNSSKWSAGTMNDLMTENGLKSLIREEWLNDWSSFFVFDGIDYVIDPFSEPRYDVSGNKISMGERVTSLTYNGKPVTNDMVFLLATNKITKPTSANKGVETQSVLGGFNRTQTVLSKYMKQLADNGNVTPQVDYNWRINIPEDKSFIVKVPYMGTELFKKTVWFKSHLKDIDRYSYFTASYPASKEDTTPPHIVVSPVIRTATASPYRIAVQVTDRSEIKKIRYMTSMARVEDFTTNNGLSLNSDNTFEVSENGSYTVYAEDVAGNKSIYQLTINNFRDDLLSSPTIDTYTNRKTKISGRGEPNTKIVFEAYTGRYEGKVSSNGTFSYALPAQPSGTVVSVYVKNEEKGLESARVEVTVKRTGPNQPSVNPISNTDGFISGDLNDKDAYMIAMIGDTVYVPEDGGKELYLKSTEIYNPSLKIVEVGFKYNDLGICTLAVPPQASGLDVKIYNLDHVSRSSRVFTTTVREDGPNAPVLYEVINIDNTIHGYIPASTPKAYDVTITLGKTSYKIKTDNKGSFSYQFTEQLHAGDIIKVAAHDEKYGTTRRSYIAELVVRDIEELVKKDSDLTLNRVTNQSYMISGNFPEKGLVYIAITNGTGASFTSTLASVEASDTGRFSLSLDRKLEAGSIVYAMVRFDNGKIYLVSKTEVLAGKPDMPILVKKITNTDKKVQLAGAKGSEMILTIGNKVYTTSTAEYDAANNRYLYSFEIDRAVSGTAVKAIAKNAAGTSEVFVSTIVKVAPDQPKVDAIKAGATKITGKIELLDYVTPEKEQTVEAGNTDTVNKEEIPERFKDAPEKVAKTQTRIYAQIGEKYYEGDIAASGKFTIEIPAQKAGTEITIFGMNKAGRGPLIKVVVK